MVRRAQFGTGSLAQPTTTEATAVTGAPYARAYDGAGLASKIENALADIQANQGGDGAVRVTAKPGGNPWTWDKDLVIDPTDYAGISLRIDENVAIEYPGSGWALTLENDWTALNGDFYKRSYITGGRWTATGDPDGWLRLRDAYFTTISPQNVAFENATGDAVGVGVENIDGWSESTLITDTRFDCNVCVDFQGADVLGTPGTSSFHGTQLRNSKFEVRGGYGVRCRGTFDYSSIDHCSFFVKGSGATLLQLGYATNFAGGGGNQTRLEGLGISDCKFEDPGGDTTGDAGILLSESYDGFYGPLLTGNKFFLDATGDEILSNSTYNGTLYQVAQRSNGVRIRELVADEAVDIKGDEIQTPAVAYQPVDVLGIFDPPQGSVAYHDPSISGDGNTEGPAFYDGSAWTSLVDGTTIA